ncbi:MAG: Na+/H+ antiporter NhaA, partial [Alphaproteobacteria bacterium]
MTLSPEAKAGLLLGAAAILGVFAENIGALRPFYDGFLETHLVVSIGEAVEIDKPLLLWINDGLMAIFFLLVALEIKRELYVGALSTWKRAALPVYAAIGGMLVPACIFLAIVGPGSEEAKGWAIPAATDIAFALAVLSLFGRRVPAELKTFLLALAVVDDLGAIVIIAIFYTGDLSMLALAGAGVSGMALALLNFAGVRRYTPYVLVGLIFWTFVLKSGVHATLAGVAIGFAIPYRPDANGHSPSEAAEH